MTSCLYAPVFEVNLESFLNGKDTVSAHPALTCLSSCSLHWLWLGIHASLPWIPGHLGHGEDQQGNASEKEEDKTSAGTGKGPGVVVLDPDCVRALDHAFDRLPHHLQ